MKTKFVVLDERGEVSWNDTGVMIESFASFKAAKARSVKLAVAAPGQRIGIYEMIAETLCPFGPATTIHAKR